MTPIVVVIFALTYVLISMQRVRVLPIGRPAGALLGATAMVVSGAMTPAESFRAIDGDTILLLLAMMMLTAELAQTGFFEWAAARTLALCRTPRRLMVAVALVAAFGSAVLVNDTICLFMTPIVVATCVRAPPARAVPGGAGHLVEHRQRRYAGRQSAEHADWQSLEIAIWHFPATASARSCC
ncbi:MAG: SLC13 family permease [Myxococcota bacterium]